MGRTIIFEINVNFINGLLKKGKMDVTRGQEQFFILLSLFFIDLMGLIIYFLHPHLLTPFVFFHLIVKRGILVDRVREQCG